MGDIRVREPCAPVVLNHTRFTSFPICSVETILGEKFLSPPTVMVPLMEASELPGNYVSTILLLQG